MPRGWWTRRANYFWYIVREFTSLPLALWLLWFLVEIQRAQNGPKGYYPHMSTGFVIFSVIICYVFNLTTTKWRFISLPDALNILRASTILTVALIVFSVGFFVYALGLPLNIWPSL